MNVFTDIKIYKSDEKYKATFPVIYFNEKHCLKISQQ